MSGFQEGAGVLLVITIGLVGASFIIRTTINAVLLLYWYICGMLKVRHLRGEAKAEALKDYVDSRAEQHEAKRFHVL